MELTEGTIVAERYRLDRRLGAGGMGEVWAATQTVTRMPVALKFLRDPSAGEDVRRRFLREARAAVAVRHPNVVQIHDVLELPGGEPVMVMELLEGESLEQRLRREGKVPLGELGAVMVRVVSAVGTAHQLGIVHRDLKPDNIFLAQTREGVEVKVLDFGIAKLTAVEGNAAETGGLTSTGAMLGTPFYMSPEQAFGEKKIDHRADIWSLGVILYRCLSGVLPTLGENIGQILKIIMTHAIRPLSEVAPELPPDVTDLVTRMLSQAPRDRPADLREVKAVLERHAGITVDPFGAPLVEAGEPAPADAAITPQAAALSARAPREGARRTALTAVAVAVALGLVTAAIFVPPKTGAGDAAKAAAAPTTSSIAPAPAEPPSAPSSAPAPSSTAAVLLAATATPAPSASSAAAPAPPSLPAKHTPRPPRPLPPPPRRRRPSPRWVASSKSRRSSGHCIGAPGICARCTRCSSATRARPRPPSRRRCCPCGPRRPSTAPAQSARHPRGAGRRRRPSPSRRARSSPRAHAWHPRAAEPWRSPTPPPSPSPRARHPRGARPPLPRRRRPPLREAASSRSSPRSSSRSSRASSCS